MAALPALKADGFTYHDYLTWPDQERWEIIHGEAFAMTPASSTRHQALLGNLFFRDQKVSSRGDIVLRGLHRPH